MRRMVVVGLIGGAVVVTAVAASRRKAPVVVADGVPEWPPLRLVEPPAEFAPVSAAAVTAAAAAEEAAGTKWVAADASGGCPDTHPVKGKRASRIFHVPGGAFYAQTKADRCFCDEDAAEADGYRRSKR